MSKLLINGSPRGTKSNSRLLINEITKSDNFTAEDWETIYLVQTKKRDEFVRKFNDADEVILVFPLYTDGTPGIVQYFIDGLSTQSDQGRKIVSFIVQSGFPEGIHSETIAEYLKLLCRKMGWNHGGTVTIGGIEGIQIKPQASNEKLFKKFRKLGDTYNHGFDTVSVANLNSPLFLSPRIRLLLSFLQPLGLLNFYWNYQLKKHGGWKKRYAAPYGKKY